MHHHTFAFSLKREYDLTPYQIEKIKNEAAMAGRMSDLQRRRIAILHRTDKAKTELDKVEERVQYLHSILEEKDNAVKKIRGAVQEYEQALVEMTSEKKIIIDSNAAKIHELQTKRDLSVTHLSSLQDSFSDLYIKYERNREIIFQLIINEEELLVEQNMALEKLKRRDLVYEKMKNFAVQKLEETNEKFENLHKIHADEIEKLSAQLKEEKTYHASLLGQLDLKAKEIEELSEMCDELLRIKKKKVKDSLINV